MNVKTKEAITLIAMQEQILKLTVKVTLLENFLLRDKLIKEEEYSQELKRATSLVSEKLNELFLKLSEELKVVPKATLEKEEESSPKEGDTQ